MGVEMERGGERVEGGRRSHTLGAQSGDIA